MSHLQVVSTIARWVPVSTATELSVLWPLQVRRALWLAPAHGTSIHQVPSLGPTGTLVDALRSENVFFAVLGAKRAFLAHGRSPSHSPRCDAAGASGSCWGGLLQVGDDLLHLAAVDAVL